MTTLIPLTEQLKSGAPLDAAAVEAAADCLLDDRCPVEERAAFLRALAARGETADQGQRQALGGKVAGQHHG